MSTSKNSSFNWTKTQATGQNGIAQQRTVVQSRSFVPRQPRHDEVEASTAETVEQAIEFAKLMSETWKGARVSVYQRPSYIDHGTDPKYGYRLGEMPSAGGYRLLATIEHGVVTPAPAPKQAAPNNLFAISSANPASQKAAA